MRIPDQVLEMLKRAQERQFVTFTTLGKDNWPHARPMDLFAIEEDGGGILFASVNPGTTLENLRRNRRAEVLVAEREPMAGYTLEGWVEYIADARAPEVQVVRAMDPAGPGGGVVRFRAPIWDGFRGSSARKLANPL